MNRRYRGTLVAFALTLLTAPAPAQSILTIAGGGPIGDGKRATEALLSLPNDVAVDAAGNLYIADGTNNRIRKVDAKTGLIETVAGGGTSGPRDNAPALAAELINPQGIAVDTGGNLFIVDGLFVRRVDAATGIISRFAGGAPQNAPLGDGGPATSARLNAASGLSFDAEGNLYIADAGNHRVRRVDRATGIISTVAGSGDTAGFSGDGGPATAAQLSSPSDTAIDAAGNLYIADRGNNRVRKVDATTGVITTIAGSGATGNIADDVPATQTPILAENIALDAAGNLYIAGGSTSIRRVDAQSGLIRTIVGRRTPEGFAGDGGPAVTASLNFPRGMAFDRSGNLFIADFRNHRIRVVDTTGVINTFAGGGDVGDNGPATSARLSDPNGIALDAQRNLLYIADQFNYRIRRVSLDTGIITTIAGTGNASIDGSGVGGPATAASFSEPFGIAVDSKGNVYFSQRIFFVRRVDAKTGVLTTYAGRRPAPGETDLGDNGPATSAILNHAQGLTFDSADHLYIADSQNNRVRRVDATTGIITTVAGTGPPTGVATPPMTDIGDGGPATAARFNLPASVIIDRAGDLIISDKFNNRVRKVTASTGIITTIAGGGNNQASGIPATQAALAAPHGLAFDPAGNLVIATSSLVRRVDAQTGLITTVAGGGTSRGDGGPALLGRLSNARGLVVDGQGNIFVSDGPNNAIRAVFTCVTVSAPSLIAPVDGATALGTAPALSWAAVAGAFRYDVLLSTTNPPSTVVGSDITSTTFTPSNLQPGTRYFWRVVAKGDPFCPSVSTTPSAVRSFNTGAVCAAPDSFDLISPAAGAEVGTTAQLIWSSSPGAGSYDVLLGTTNPPPMIASTATTNFTATNLSAGTTYFWGVVARASCDSALVTRAAIRSFRVAGGCPTPGPVSLVTPADGSENVATTTTFEWTAAANASSYDLYLGTTNPPPVYLLDLTATRLTIAGFQTGQTYFWRVVAKVACDSARTTSSAVGRFRIRGDCAIPRQTTITFAPPGSVGAGQAYVVAWQDAQDLEPGGFYLIERSQSESFATVIDTQETTSNSASFVATDPGLYYHRVRPVNRCSPTSMGTSSAARSVNVVAALPNVVFTVQPEAVLTTLGENLEDRRTRFVVENIGTESISVLVGRQEIDSSPFFTIADPRGGDSTFLTLQPRVPRELEVRFSGPPNDRAGSYQGIIFLASIGRGLAITPYGFVNLRVGGGETSTPEFLKDGLATEYTFFPGFSGDDTDRPSVTIDIRNSGSAPMELGAEIGPEVWLVPESGWNDTAIPPGATRSVKLFTRRSRAPNGSALPRYTYFTVRTKSGQSARLLVQDNDLPPTSLGRLAALDPSTRSFIIPEVSSVAAGGGSRRFSIVRLSNLGSEPITAELFFTPEGSDGFDATRVQRATIAVPPNDVVTLTDPLVQLWNLSRPAKGQLEVRASQEKIGQLALIAVVTQNAPGGGAFSATIPTVLRGEGARSGMAHQVAGLFSDTTSRAALVVAETSGADRVSVRVTLFDSDGTSRGERVIDLPRYGMTEIEDAAAALAGGSVLQGARLELSVTGGGGSAIGVVKLLDRTNGGGATLISRPVDAASSTQSFTNVGAGFSPPRNGLKPVPTLWQRLRNDQTAPARTFLLPAVFAGSSAGAQLQTTLGLYAAREVTTFNLTFRHGDSTQTATVTVPARKIVEYANVLQQLFATSSGEGSLLVEATGASDVYARLTSATTGASRVTVSQTLPVITSDSEFATTPASQRPLYLDGLEQSIDSTRGTNWSLILNEIGGKGATVVVRLYEAGNRSAPIAQKEFPLAALQRLKLPSVFGALDLDSINRRKDRTNMLVSVVYKSGAGAATAIAMATDNRTGDSKSYILGPASSSSPFSVQRATAVAPKGTERRRAVRH